MIRGYKQRKQTDQSLALVLQVFPVDPVELVEDASNGCESRLAVREQHVLAHQQDHLLTVLAQQEEVYQLTLQGRDSLSAR